MNGWRTNWMKRKGMQDNFTHQDSQPSSKCPAYMKLGHRPSTVALCDRSSRHCIAPTSRCAAADVRDGRGVGTQVSQHSFRLVIASAAATMAVGGCSSSAPGPRARFVWCRPSGVPRTCTLSEGCAGRARSGSTAWHRQSFPSKKFAPLRPSIDRYFAGSCPPACRPIFLHSDAMICPSSMCTRFRRLRRTFRDYETVLTISIHGLIATKQLFSFLATLYETISWASRKFAIKTSCEYLGPKQWQRWYASKIILRTFNISF